MRTLNMWQQHVLAARISVMSSGASDDDTPRQRSRAAVRKCAQIAGSTPQERDFKQGTMQGKRTSGSARLSRCHHLRRVLFRYRVRRDGCITRNNGGCIRVGCEYHTASVLCHSIIADALRASGKRIAAGQLHIIKEMACTTILFYFSMRVVLLLIFFAAV